MKVPPSIAVPIAILGSTAATGLTLLHYARAHLESVPGGHLALLGGSAAVGLLCGFGIYVAGPSGYRTIAQSLAAGLAVAFAAAFFLSAIISRSSGALP